MTNLYDIRMNKSLSIVESTIYLHNIRLWFEEQILNYGVSPQTERKRLKLARDRFFHKVNHLNQFDTEIGSLSSKTDKLEQYDAQDILKAIEEISACIHLAFKSRIWAHNEKTNHLYIFNKMDIAHLTNRIKELSEISQN